MTQRTESLYGLDIYHEGTNIGAQEACTHELEAVLCELHELVRTSRMPQETRRRLYCGLAHLKGHIQCELVAMVTEAMVRCQ